MPRLYVVSPVLQVTMLALYGAFNAISLQLIMLYCDLRKLDTKLI